MKLKNNVARILLCTLVVLLLAMMGCTSKDLKTITGTVEQTDRGLVIQTDNGEYTTAGVNLMALAGKKVEATGKVTKDHTGKVFNIVAVRELKLAP